MKNRPYPIDLIRSGRKTVGIQITDDGRVLVRAPYRMRIREIDKLVDEKDSWIQKHLQKKSEAQQKALSAGLLSHEDIQHLADQALQFIPERVAHFAKVLGVDYGRITIRNQKTRWGSCSSVGNLNFNCLLMLTPAEVMDYVVVHELCHLKEMNHSPKFWKCVESILPDYRERRQWLKENGNGILMRMMG